jgi:polar amino acid transport system substrate-binding protein
MSTRFALACSALAAVVLAGALSAPRGDYPVPVMAAGAGSTTVVPLVARSAPGPAPATPECTPQNRLASLRQQGPLPPPGHMAAGSTMAQIAQRGHLTVGVLEDTPPMAFRNMSRDLVGFDIDIAHDIAQAIFGDPGRVVFRPLAEAARFDAVKSGQVDLTIASATVTCQRRDQVDFSTVYYQAGQRLLVNRGSGITGLDDLRGQRVCAARGTTSVSTIRADPSKPILVSTATQTDCLMLLQLGEVDAVITDDTILAGMHAQDPRTELVGPRFTAEPCGVVINKDAPDLVRFVNAVLQRRVADGRWQASYQRWLAPLGLPASRPAPQYQD